MPGNFERVLRVFDTRCEFESSPGQVEVFLEGPTSDDARKRLRLIESWFNDRKLDEMFEQVKANPESSVLNDKTIKKHIDELVASITSERGRALVGLTVMQLAIKVACPEQSIRLHKGGPSHGGERFSWAEGVSMRSLDRNYVTPFLRAQDLIRLNIDGFMMTRSLAENYPYSALYKAALRGARQQWLEVTELLESGKCDAEVTLKYLLSILINRSDSFSALADEVLRKLAIDIDKDTPSLDSTIEWMINVVESTEYSARLFEVAMHSLYQAFDDLKKLPSPLKPLSQMRSANKKHGNIGDIELLRRQGHTAIIEAWDAKYGKPYLRDELDEIDDKLQDHPETELVGFVASEAPQVTSDIQDRIDDLQAVHGTEVRIMEFSSWVKYSSERFGLEEGILAAKWKRCFIESVAQKRRDAAPIDEPCEAWLKYIDSKL